MGVLGIERPRDDTGPERVRDVSLPAPSPRQEPFPFTVAIAHDYLTQRGGAERVVLSLARAFPGAPILTSLYDAGTTYPEFADLPISSSGIDRYQLFRRNHRMALPFLPRSFAGLYAAADVVVCSSSGWAHGVPTGGRKVVYCHNPARWLYQATGYEPGRGRPARVALGLLGPRMVSWDRSAALSADRYLANSTVVQQRIANAYGIEAEILHPPPGLDRDGVREPLSGLDPGYVLCVSRLISYKNVDAVVAAMELLREHRLVVVGTGPDERKLRAAAPSNVTFLGGVSDGQLRWLYTNALAYVSASYEDFGLGPIEAGLFGTPSALLRFGGFLDTLEEGTNGFYFDEPEPVAIARCINAVAQTTWRDADIEAHADTFSSPRFERRIQEIVAEEASCRPPDDDQASADRAPGATPLAVPARRAHPVAPAVPAWRGQVTKAVVIAIDAVAVMSAMMVAFVLTAALDAPGTEGFERVHVQLGLLGVPIWLVCFARVGLYQSRLIVSRMEESRRVVRGVLLGVAGTAAAGSLARLSGARSWYILAALTGVAVVGGARLALSRLFKFIRRGGRLLRPTLVIGGNGEAAAVVATFDADPSLGYSIVGQLSDEPLGDGSRHLGSVADTCSVVRRTGVTAAVIATTAVDYDTTNRLVRQLSDMGVHVELSVSMRDIAHRRLTMRPVSHLPLVHVSPVNRHGWQAMAKRMFDVAAASVLLLVTAPLMAAAAAAIKLESTHDPVLFRQRRLGRNGRPYNLLKLRTMVADAEQKLALVQHRNEADGPLFKLREDPRITRVGRVLRRLSIDELPQLWNVLRGEMSMVGPRPALPREAPAWSEALHARLCVRPGITGMWQVNGRSTSSFAEYERLDLYYVENWSLATDLAIVARTVPAVLRTRGAF